MTTNRKKSPVPSSYTTDDARWRAMLRRDHAADGEFFFAVRTTGVYCRPSCPSRRPLRKNVRFHSTSAAAERAGFRPCQRCRPREASLAQRQREQVIRACRWIERSEKLPKLQELADSAGLSPAHFHRIFKTTTGVTPKAYAAAHRARRVEAQLAKGRSVTEAVYNAGFNSNGRFYASSSARLGMKPSDFRAGGRGAAIRFAVNECSLGKILVAASEKGICAILLGDDAESVERELQGRFPQAQLAGNDARLKQHVAAVIRLVERPESTGDLPLDIRGTAFQIRVWEELRRVRPGATTNYAALAKKIGRPRAVRAVARAVAANPLAVAVPCHRVIRKDRSLAGYRWGVRRKAELLHREAAAKDAEGVA